MFFIEKGCANHLAHVAKFVEYSNVAKCIDYCNTECRLYAKDRRRGGWDSERTGQREKQTSCGVLALPLTPFMTVMTFLLVLKIEFKKEKSCEYVFQRASSHENT